MICEGELEVNTRSSLPGLSDESFSNSTSPASGGPVPELRWRQLHAHDLLLFALGELFDLGDVGVGEFLDLVEGAALGVLGDGFVFQHLLQPLVAVATHVADGGA